MASLAVRLLSSEPGPVFSWVDIVTVSVAYSLATLLVEHGGATAVSSALNEIRNAGRQRRHATARARSPREEIARVDASSKDMSEILATIEALTRNTEHLVAGKRVLVLDDVDTFRATVRSTLSSCDVMEAIVDRERVPGLIREASPQVVVFDMARAEDLRGLVERSDMRDIGMIGVSRPEKGGFLRTTEIRLGSLSAEVESTTLAIAFRLEVGLGRYRV